MRIPLVLWLAAMIAAFAPPTEARANAEPTVAETVRAVVRAHELGVYGYLHAPGRSVVVLGRAPRSLGVATGVLLGGPRPDAQWVIAAHPLAESAAPELRVLEGARVRIVRGSSTCDVTAGRAYVASFVSTSRLESELEGSEEPDLLRRSIAELVLAVDGIGRGHEQLVVEVPDTCGPGILATRWLENEPRVHPAANPSPRADRPYLTRYRRTREVARFLRRPRAEDELERWVYVRRHPLANRRELVLAVHGYTSFGSCDDDSVPLGRLLYLREGSSVREVPDASDSFTVVDPRGDGNLALVHEYGDLEVSIDWLDWAAGRSETILTFYANANLGC